MKSTCVFALLTSCSVTALAGGPAEGRGTVRSDIEWPVKQAEFRHKKRINREETSKLQFDFQHLVTSSSAAIFAICSLFVRFLCLISACFTGDYWGHWRLRTVRFFVLIAAGIVVTAVEFFA
jgi:hypothetical protein